MKFLKVCCIFFRLVANLGLYSVHDVYGAYVCLNTCVIFVLNELICVF